MNKTIGIFGGGQLGRMMAQAALPLNLQCTFFEAETKAFLTIIVPTVHYICASEPQSHRMPLPSGLERHIVPFWKQYTLLFGHKKRLDFRQTFLCFRISRLQ